MLFKKSHFRLNHHILTITFIFIAAVGSVFSQTTQVDQSKTLVLKSVHIGPNHTDVLSSSNRSGFEIGQVVKIDSVYHKFVNEMFERPHRDMRIAYWTSDDAVFAVNDPNALGAYEYIKDKAQKISEDIAMAGFSNNPVASWVTSSLTSINPPGFEMGKKLQEF